MSHFEETAAALIKGRAADVERLARQALAAGETPQAVLQEGLFAGMDVIAVRFRDREVFLPEVLLAARAMNAGLAVLQPLLEGEALLNKGTVVMGTVEGDLHDIGKQLVCIMLRGAGYEVVDLGHGVSPTDFVEAAQKHGAQVVGMSALLTTTMPAMGRVVTALAEAGLDQVKTMVGGAPVTEQFADDIGAGAYGYDATTAVDLVRSFIP